ncbi:hypothetical protein HPP92_014248 [Vanilla planifolia]|uniref:Uncharacterized protein n=1 Tax=Vanilla planifolia TaxID=51239 RepID=A0A835UUK6_VANPL|nr:hypothetical protein HPP92_014248 [Vanilla planifolia]
MRKEKGLNGLCIFAAPKATATVWEAAYPDSTKQMDSVRKRWSGRRHRREVAARLKQFRSTITVSGEEKAGIEIQEHKYFL